MTRLAPPSTPSLRERMPRYWVLALAAAAAVVLTALAVALALTARPSFLGGYHDLEREYATLQESAHSSVACDGCHVGGGVAQIEYRAGLVGDFYGGLIGKPESPRFVRIESPTNGACLSCHREDWSDNVARTTEIPHPAHLRVAEEDRRCVECHKWTAHDEEYIERHKEMPFSGVCASFGCHAGWKSVEECGACHHAVQEEGAVWTVEHKDAVRAHGPNGCLESCHDADQCRQCHTTGVRPDFPEVGPDSGLRAIEAAHVEVDWMEQHGSFALQDDSKCFACHVSTGECDSCHSQRPEFHGPESTWLNRHADFAEDERTCLTCHEKDWCEDCHDQFKEMR